MGWTLTSLIEYVTELIALTIPLALGLALLAFFWSIVQGFGKTDDVKKRAELRQSILWILLALFVMVSLGGIIAVFTATLDI